MASHNNNVIPTTTGSSNKEKSFFEQEREALISDIALSFNNVLTNLNNLNRSLEAVIAVGNEFSSVEGLWSQFENVMGKDDEESKPEEAGPDHDDADAHARVEADGDVKMEQAQDDDSEATLQ
ncbi:hypothetical protein TD95_003891 [Thielaviopsis punctulata]|uniref:DASH complex subunit DAD1 n=1 Tax=Thielaviopsis punctulata TaxID=72032 RepID=A0A0F4ZGK3_9PEZI|nr:hypothetical protein TD95_003891 [Thielaviopsis punctulata]